MGNIPIKTTFYPKTDMCRVLFARECCEKCPHREECKAKAQKKNYAVHVSAKMVERARYLDKLSTDEYKQLTRKRNAIEGIPSVLRRRYQIRCGCCGENYRRQAYTNAAGEQLARWYCANQKEHKQNCKMPGVDETFLKATCADALGLPEFDEAAFTEQVDHITITGIGKLTIFFKDGHTYDGTYAANRYGTPFTEERRRRHSEIMRKYWRERNGE